MILFKTKRETSVEFHCKGAAISSIKTRNALELVMFNESARYQGIVGRCANRINNASFILNDQEYSLSGPLHGGIDGFDNAVWNLLSKAEDSVSFFLLDKDNNQGYPCDLLITATYKISETIDYLSIKLEISAKNQDSIRSTIFNPTIHTHFNLSGFKTDILAHTLQIPNQIAAIKVNDFLIPIGVSSDPLLSFRNEKQLGRDITMFDKDPFYGFDHYFKIKETESSVSLAAILKYSDVSLKVYTSSIGFQIYTGNWLNGEYKSRDGIVYNKWSCIAIEPMDPVDAINQEDRDLVIIKPGQEKRQFIEFKFTGI